MELSSRRINVNLRRNFRIIKIESEPGSGHKENRVGCRHRLECGGEATRSEN